MGRLIRPLPDGGRHQLLVIFPHFERVEFKSSDTVTADYAGIPGEKCRTAQKKVLHAAYGHARTEKMVE